MRHGSLTRTLVIDPPGTRVLWAERVGPWLVAVAHYPPGDGLRWHAHEHASFHLTVGGASRERYWSVERAKLAGTAQYYAPGVGHETSFGPRGATVLHAVCDAERTRAAGVLDEPDPRPMLDAWRAIGRGDAASLLEIEDACEALSTSVGRESAAESTTPGWALRVRQRLFESPEALPTLAELARDAGVHPAHLARTFRDRFRTTVGAFARGRRLQIAADALVTTDRPIASIAIEAGFCDQSHFGRVFGRRYGTTPARFRAELRATASRWVVSSRR
ncbi:MAG: AraC family transcriptional regulator [Planctomycetota bacterium]